MLRELSPSPSTTSNATSVEMTSDDQYFLDQLGRVSSSIRKFSGDVFDASDKQLSDASNVVARYLNAVLPSSWSIRPPPIPQPPPAIQRSYLQLVQIWVSRHRAVTAALIGFLGTGAIGAMVLYSQSGAPSRKRRAKRAKNGARKEVIGKHKSRCYLSSIHV
jgi:hypothetical protein